MEVNCRFSECWKSKFALIKSILLNLAGFDTLVLYQWIMREVSHTDPSIRIMRILILIPIVYAFYLRVPRMLGGA